MPTILYSLALLLTTGGMVLANPAPRPNTDSLAVAQAVESLRKAMIDADKPTLERLLTDQLSYGHSGGNIETKAAFIESLVTGTSDFQTIDLSVQRISIVDKTALVRHNLVAATNNRGVAATVNLSVLLVWIKQGKDWKLLARQAVKRP
jgi:Domain of unknown function (DUF4440)